MIADDQLDIFRDDMRRRALAYREAAEAARRNPYETEEQREVRAKHYEREADRIETQLQGVKS